MNLFEDWYITYYEGYIDIEDDLEKGQYGEYTDVRVAMMYQAFLAGQVLTKFDNSLGINEE